jgi:hypothetical protein
MKRYTYILLALITCGEPAFAYTTNYGTYIVPSTTYTEPDSCDWVEIEVGAVRLACTEVTHIR